MIHIFIQYDTYLDLDYCTYPLNTDTSIGGRCGPRFGNVRCNQDLRSYAVYCNQANGWCGVTSPHQNVQARDVYDYKPQSCNWKCPPLNEDPDHPDKCGPKFGNVRCNPNLASSAIYCNEDNGWCANSASYKNAQASDVFDFKPSQCIIV